MEASSIGSSQRDKGGAVTAVNPAAGTVLVDSPHAVSVSPAPNSSSVTFVEALGKASVAVLIAATILATLLSGMAFMRTEATDKRLEARIAAAEERARLSERESRVLQERWNDLKVELAKRNILHSDH